MILLDHKALKKYEFDIFSYKKMPERPGVYILYDKNNSVLYAGKTKNLNYRITKYAKGESHLNHIRFLIRKVAFYEVKCPFERELYETYSINTFKPSYNVLKKYTYSSEINEEETLKLNEINKKDWLKEYQKVLFNREAVLRNYANQIANLLRKNKITTYVRFTEMGDKELGVKFRSYLKKNWSRNGEYILEVFKEYDLHIGTVGIRNERQVMILSNQA